MTTDNRQAGADEPEIADEEEVVTPEMLDAGATYLADIMSQPRDGVTDLLVAHLYRIMRRCADPHS